MNVKTAKNLKPGDMVYHLFKKNADGTPMRAKVTSVRTWYRSPDKVLVKVKHGLYDFASFDEKEIYQLSTEEIS